MAKGQTVLQYYDDHLGRTWASRLSEHRLIELGSISCPTDYAVRNYRRPNHPKFFGNRSGLEQAVRRSLSRRTFPDREERLRQMVSMLLSELGDET
jgi:hypothetical protein